MVTQEKTPRMSREEEIGYHKGALNTLVNERTEFVRLVHVVDALIHGHIKRLEELGVKIQQGKK